MKDNNREGCNFSLSRKWLNSLKRSMFLFISLCSLLEFFIILRAKMFNSFSLYFFFALYTPVKKSPGKLRKSSKIIVKFCKTNSTTGKYCKVAFRWTSILYLTKDFIQTLKSENNDGYFNNIVKEINWSLTVLLLLTDSWIKPPYQHVNSPNRSHLFIMLLFGRICLVIIFLILMSCKSDLVVTL